MSGPDEPMAPDSDDDREDHLRTEAAQITATIVQDLADLATILERGLRDLRHVIRSVQERGPLD